MLDRFLENVHLVKISGKSYRMRGKQKQDSQEVNEGEQASLEPESEV